MVQRPGRHCFSLFTRRVWRKEMTRRAQGANRNVGEDDGDTHPSCSTRKRVRACGKEAVGQITWLSRGNKRGKNARHSFQLLLCQEGGGEACATVFLSYFLFTFSFSLSNPGSGEVVRLGRITYSFLVYYILFSFSFPLFPHCFPTHSVWWLRIWSPGTAPSSQG